MEVSSLDDQATVLIVDDNAANLSVLFEYLKLSGFKTLIAEDGEEALSTVKHVKPDIILLDIMMPGIDGFDTCQSLKNNKDTKEIPVIFMTALSETLDKVKGFSCGAVDYITKPFQNEEVLARINTHLTIQRQKKALSDALAKVKTLSGLLPICANCKKIRNDEGYWENVEAYIRSHANVDFSHGICPGCAKKLYPNIYEKIEKRFSNEN